MEVNTKYKQLKLFINFPVGKRPCTDPLLKVADNIYSIFAV